MCNQGKGEHALSSGCMMMPDKGRPGLILAKDKNCGGNICFCWNAVLPISVILLAAILCNIVSPIYVIASLAPKCIFIIGFYIGQNRTGLKSLF